MKRTIQQNTHHRADALKQGLLERQRELRDGVHHRIRDGRARRAQEGTDDLEQSEADSQDHLALALLQMQSEALVQVDAALARLDSDEYGLCVECEREIATQRLSALPFAVRCQGCEGNREQAHGHTRRHSQSGGAPVRLSDLGLFHDAR